MCVPGVQAWATLGVKSKASRIASATLLAMAARDEARGILVLDPDPLTLAANCFAKIVELVSDGVVDCFTRGVGIVTN